MLSKSGKCLGAVRGFEAPITAAAWAPDGQSFVLGSLDIKKPLSIWPVDLGADPQPLHIFDENRDQLSRVSDLAVAARLPSPLDPAYADAVTAATSHRSTTSSPSPSHSQPLTRIVAACVDKRAIHIIDYHRREKTGSFHVDHDMTCLSLSRDGEEMLMNMSCGEVWTIDVNSQDVKKKFRGQKQGKYVIRSCYGGAREGFVLSGGEGQSSNCLESRFSFLATSA